MRVVSPRPNFRKQGFEVAGTFVPFPENKKLYTAKEACAILIDIEGIKKHCISKVVDVMLSSTPKYLIPVGRSAMFCVLKNIVQKRTCPGY